MVVIIKEIIIPRVNPINNPIIKIIGIGSPGKPKGSLLMVGLVINSHGSFNLASSRDKLLN